MFISNVGAVLAQHVAVGGSYRDNKLVALSLTDGRVRLLCIKRAGGELRHG